MCFIEHLLRISCFKLSLVLVPIGASPSYHPFMVFLYHFSIFSIDIYNSCTIKFTTVKYMTVQWFLDIHKVVQPSPH